MAAAMDLDLVAFLRFKLGDLPGNVTLEQDRVAPGDLIERLRSHELRPGVKCRGNLVGRIRGLRPRACEDFIGLTAEQESAGALGPFGHDLDELFVEIRDEPPTVLEAAVTVFV